MNYVVKSTSFVFNGLYLRKSTPHSICWTSFPMGAQYFPEENQARVAMQELGIYHFQVEEAPVPYKTNAAFELFREAAARMTS